MDMSLKTGSVSPLPVDVRVAKGHTSKSQLTESIRKMVGVEDAYQTPPDYRISADLIMEIP